MLETNQLPSQYADDILNIVDNKTGNIKNVKHDFIIHTPKTDLLVDKPFSVEIYTDYNSRVAPEINISFAMPMGDFIKDIYPYRNNLEVTLKKYDTNTSSVGKYKLVLSDIDETIISKMSSSRTRNQLNTDGYTRCKGQCISLVVEALNLSSVCGIYRDNTCTDVIKAVFKEALSDIKIGGKQPPVNISVRVAHVKDGHYDHIMIPPGTRVLDVPSLLQNGDYGVYAGNIGTFIDKYTQRANFTPYAKTKTLDVLWVYPLYNYARPPGSTERKLVIYSSDSAIYGFNENTYRVTSSSVEVITGVDAKVVSQGDNQFINGASGFLSIDSNKVLSTGYNKESVKISKPKVESKPKDLVKDNLFKIRSDSIMYKHYMKPSDNVQKQASEILYKNGIILQFTWNYSETNLLHPGMLVTYNYTNVHGDKVLARGVLQSHYTFYKNDDKTVTTMLNVFLEKDKSEYV